MEIGPAEVMTS